MGLFHIGTDVILVFACTFILVALIQRFAFAISPLSAFPGPWGLPIVGHLPFLGVQALHQMSKAHGNAFRIRMGSRPALVISGCDTVRQVLVTQTRDFAGRPDFYTFSIMAKGKSFAFRKFDSGWRIHRNIGKKALMLYLTNCLKGFHSTIKKRADLLVDSFLRQRVPSWQKEFDMTAASIVYHALYGSTGELPQNQGYVPIIEIQFKMNRTLGAGRNPIDVMPWLKVFLRNSAQMRFVYECEMAHERENKRLHEEHLTRYDSRSTSDVTDMLIRVMAETDTKVLSSVAKGQLDILRITRDMMSAGIETISDTLQWALLCVAK